MEKIGLGVITCDRIDFLKKCEASIPRNRLHEYILVDDTTTRAGVGKSKNIAISKLMDSGCDHIFLCEDDMEIIDPNIFDAYIAASKGTGIQHFNFGYHGPANKNSDDTKAPRKIIQYENYLKIALNPNCVGAFSYYSRKCIETVGLMDETFHNAWEHVEHTYRIIKVGMHPPFWWFADIADSDIYIRELACSEVSSTIRKTPEWTSNMISGMNYFKEQHGYAPVEIPFETNIVNISAELIKIHNKYK